MIFQANDTRIAWARNLCGKWGVYRLILLGVLASQGYDPDMMMSRPQPKVALSSMLNPFQPPTGNRCIKGMLLALVLMGGYLGIYRPSAATPSYVHEAPIQIDDTPEDIISKAASIVPNEPQIICHQDEFSAFIHFGINTFSGVEWGSGKEKASIFDPGDSLDTDQWCRIMKAAEMKRVIITVKHHDGFCLWQSRYNDSFSVRSIPWRQGKGDVLRELSDSCRKHGLKLGVYLSPADLYQIENEKGLYGNLSKYQTTVIPTDPESFKSDPTQVRADRPQGKPTFTVMADDYNRYFMNQLYELLTEYGPIHEVWFDGAHPKRKGGQTYIKQQWYDMIRVLAPKAAIFGGPDIRWCGNEGGRTRPGEWNILPVQDAATCGEDRPVPSPGSEAALTAGGYHVYGKPYSSKQLYYMLAEVNTSIRAGWFWRNEHEQSVRTPDDVFDMYERAVGGNANYLLNIPPDNHGRFAARDEACLLEVGKRIRATYSKNLIDGAVVDVADGSHDLTDSDLTTYWQADDKQAALIVRLNQAQTINRFVLQEAITKVGQRIKSHALDAWVNGAWQEVASASTVGYKRILRFPVVTTDRFRVRILDARLAPAMADLAAHYYQQAPPLVAVRRNQDDRVVLETVAPSNQFVWNHSRGQAKIPNDHAHAKIYYTLDCQEPSGDSLNYTTPLDLPNGAHIRARAMSGATAGSITDVRLGISKKDWRIQNVTSAQDKNHLATLAIDGDSQTAWLSAVDQEYPQALTIDMGRLVRVAAITYLPHQDTLNPIGMIEKARLELSSDGETWQSGGRFNFGNLLNDPTERTYRLETPATARFVRITSEAGAQGTNQAGAAEIGVLIE